MFLIGLCLLEARSDGLALIGGYRECSFRDRCERLVGAPPQRGAVQYLQHTGARAGVLDVRYGLGPFSWPRVPESPVRFVLWPRPWVQELRYVRRSDSRPRPDLRPVPPA